MVFGSGVLWDVGGNPDKIRSAAEAFSWLADDLRLQSTILDSVTTGTLDTWREGESSEAFKQASEKINAANNQYAGGLDELAGKLKDVAKQIEDAQDAARNFQRTAAAAVATGVALTVFSAGFSNAAGWAAAAGAAAGFWAMMARVAAVLLRAAAAFRSIKTVKMVSLGLAISAGSKAGFKAIAPGSDPWTANDASDIIFGGAISGGMFNLATALKAMPALAGMTGTKAALLKLGGNGLAGLGGATTGSALDNYFLLKNDGRSFSEKLGTVAQTAGIGFASGLALRGIFGLNARRPVTRDLKAPIGTPMRGGLLSPNSLRLLTGLPVGGALYYLNLGKHKDEPITGLTSGLPRLTQKPPNSSSTNPPNSSSQNPSAPRGQAPPKTVTVRQGESLSAIAQRVYGDSSKYPEIAKANNIDPSQPIYPRQILRIP